MQNAKLTANCKIRSASFPWGFQKISGIVLGTILAGTFIRYEKKIYYCHLVCGRA
jgi:predicted membrane protein